MKTKILCVVCAAAVLLLSLGIFVGAVHINTEEKMSIQRTMPHMRGGMPGDAPPIGGENNTTNGAIDGESGGSSGDNGIMGDNFPNGGADAPGDGGTGDGGLNGGADGGVTDGGMDGDMGDDGIAPDDMAPPADGTNEILPETNVPDTDIGGAVEDNDGDGVSDPKDTDDDGDGLPDAVDPDADGDKVEDERELTGVVGIILAVIIVIAVIAVVFDLMPKKKK